MATYKQAKKAAPAVLREEPQTLQMSAANVRTGQYPSTKTDGIKIRGTGAATKGLKARGPMA